MEKHSNFFEQAAWKGNRESVIHLSHLAPLMSKRQGELAKYTAMCYHWGIGGKSKKNSKAAKYLNQSVLDNFDQTLTYVKKHGKKLALDILKKSSLMAKLDFDFLLSLFNDADIRSKLTHQEIANFLIYCAKNYPTHHWVRDYSYFLSTIKALKNDPLSEKLIHVYFTVALLNDDNPPSKVKKYIKRLITIEQETLEKLLEKLSPHYEKDKINQVLHVIQAYQQLRNQKHPSTEDISADLNSDELHQLFNLVENSKYIRKKHTLERVIQKAAFVELHSEENHEVRKEKMEQALNDPLFKNRHTFFFNPARLLPVKELTELKNELKTMDTDKISDDENEAYDTMKLSQ